MSNLNHIIIPTVKNRPEHEEMNVFQSANICLTPEKEVPFSKILVSKKYHSAFKIYKQKKEKKEQNQEGPSMNLGNEGVRNQKKVVKLKIREFTLPTINKNNEQSTTLSLKPVYYDPNQAPLYKQNSDLTTELSKQPTEILQKTERIQEEIQVQLQQKIKNEPLPEQEIFYKYLQLNYQDDDPFIIMKRTHNKKDKKDKIETIKSKPIKKDKKAAADETNQKKKQKNMDKYMKAFQPSRTFEINKQALVVSFTPNSDFAQFGKKNDLKPMLETERPYELVMQRPCQVGQSSFKQVMPSSFLISRADVMI